MVARPSRAEQGKGGAGPVRAAEKKGRREREREGEGKRKRKWEKKGEREGNGKRERKGGIRAVIAAPGRPRAAPGRA